MSPGGIIGKGQEGWSNVHAKFVYHTARHVWISVCVAMQTHKFTSAEDLAITYIFLEHLEIMIST